MTIEQENKICAHWLLHYQDCLWDCAWNKIVDIAAREAIRRRLL